MLHAWIVMVFVWSSCFQSNGDEIINESYDTWLYIGSYMLSIGIIAWVVDIDIVHHERTRQHIINNANPSYSSTQVDYIHAEKDDVQISNTIPILF